MSYEDLKEVRNTRAAKDNAKATAGKGKRGRKRKCSELGLDSEREQEAEAGLSVPVRKAKATRKIDATKPARVVERAKAPKPWRAPVARMY